MTVRGTFNNITTAALTNVQSIARAAMGKADAAATAATTANSTASGAVATLEQLTAAQAGADAIHASLQAQIDALKATAGTAAITRIATGNAATPLLALNGTIDIVITLSRAMSNTSYNTEPLQSTALLGRASLTLKSKTTTTVTYTLKANLALTADSLGVVAWQTG